MRQIDFREDVKLLPKRQPMKWSSFFKYFGSPISGIEGICFLEDSVLANITKICGALSSACRSAVALPLSRVVDLNQTLASLYAAELCCMGPLFEARWLMVFFDVRPLVEGGRDESTAWKGLRPPLRARFWDMAFGSHEDALEVHRANGERSASVFPSGVAR